MPNVEVSTEKARGVLPDTYSRTNVATAISNAILTSQALQEGSLPLLQPQHTILYMNHIVKS